MKDKIEIDPYQGYPGIFGIQGPSGVYTTNPICSKCFSIIDKSDICVSCLAKNRLEKIDQILKPV